MTSVLWNSGTSTRQKPKIAGIYSLQHESGFPVEMSFELAREKGCDVDWVEAFLSALERNPREYDTLLKQSKLIDPEYAEECERGFHFGLSMLGTLEAFREYEDQKKSTLNP
jgi:alanyl-tRNA synthetase